MLVQPHVPLVYTCSPLFSLVEPHVLSNCTHSTFVSLLICICGVLVQPCVPLVCAHLPLFALVQPCVLSIHACLTFGQALLPPHVTLQVVEPRATAMMGHIYLLDIIVYRTKHTIFDRSYHHLGSWAWSRRFVYRCPH